MTQQVRKSYRNHRKSTWALVLAVVAAIATVVIPFATGAPSKYYTLGASPEPTCSTPTLQTFTLTLSNKTRNQNLGSANITAPEYIDLVDGSAEITGSAGTATVNVPDSFGDEDNTIRLRNLTLPTSSSAAIIEVDAYVEVGSGETWTSIAKQSNNFADSGPGNLFAPQTAGAGSPSATVTACALDYVFVDEPDDAEKGSAQAVKVQLQSGGVAVPVSGPLTLDALQGGQSIVNPDPAVFTGLTASGPDAVGAYAGKQWTFSVVGKVSGTGYALQAGDTISDPTFSIADGVCQPNTTDPEHLDSSCSLTSDLNGGVLESGVTINNHKLTPITINFAAGSTATGKCANWAQATYQVGDDTYVFPGVELDLVWGGGVLQVIYRVRNADWVLTDAARGNNDIEICVGAKHQEASKNGVGPSADPFTTKFGEDAVWNGVDGLFWGVLPTVSNPSKVKAGGDPAVCSRGNQDLPTGLNGSSETWRTWTVCIPFDWDWKNFG